MASGKPLKAEKGEAPPVFRYQVLRDIPYKGRVYKMGEVVELPQIPGEPAPPYHFWPINGGPVQDWPERSPYTKPRNLPTVKKQEEQPDTLSERTSKLGKPLRGKPKEK